MIKDNQKHFNRLHVVIDGLVIALSYALAFFIRFLSGWIPFPEGYVYVDTELPLYFSLLIYIIPLYLILSSIFQLYTPKRVTGRKKEVQNIFIVYSMGTVLLIGGLYMLRHMDYSRTMFGLFYVISTTAEIIVRTLVKSFLWRIRTNGRNLKYILMVGYSSAAEEYINRIKANPEWGYVAFGILDDKVLPDTEYRGIRVLGKIDTLQYILAENKLDEIAVTLALEDYSHLEQVVGLCEKSGIHTKFIPDYHRVIPSRPYTEDLQGLPVINIRHVPLTNTVNAFFKRLTDIVGSLLGLIVSSPLLIVCAIVIKFTSKGPVIFSQERVGLHNQTFHMYKFRSMMLQTKEDEAKGWTTKDDPRVTKFGKFMRRTSIDELPQLINILTGRMSLVGPRPERPQFVEEFKEEIPRYMIKHQVRPGLTGWAQVNGYRGDTSIEKRIEFDIHYIENWTYGFDVRILFLTIFKGFINKNAY